MNYEQARELQGNAGWHWTRMQGSYESAHIYKGECCKAHEGAHATKEEAEECYAAWRIANVTKHRALSRPHICVHTGGATSEAISFPGGGIQQIIPLCPSLHDDPEVIAKLAGKPTQVQWS